MRGARGILIILALSWPVPGWGEERLGRLFFTPEERVAIDQARRLAEMRKAQEDPTGLFSGQELTVNGVTLRGGRTVAVWVNGQTPLGEWQFPAWVRPRESGTWVEVDMPQEAGTLRLKPGQVADRNRGLIKEAYQVTVATPRLVEEAAAAPAREPPTAQARELPTQVDVENLMKDAKKLRQLQEEVNRLSSTRR